jgi:hypothetical protein
MLLHTPLSLELQQLLPQHVLLPIMLQLRDSRVLSGHVARLLWSSVRGVSHQLFHVSTVAPAAREPVANRSRPLTKRFLQPTFLAKKLSLLGRGGFADTSRQQSRAPRTWTGALARWAGETPNAATAPLRPADV